MPPYERNFPQHVISFLSDKIKDIKDIMYVTMWAVSHEKVPTVRSLILRNHFL